MRKSLKIVLEEDKENKEEIKTLPPLPTDKTVFTSKEPVQKINKFKRLRDKTEERRKKQLERKQQSNEFNFISQNNDRDKSIIIYPNNHVKKQEKKRLNVYRPFKQKCFCGFESTDKMQYIEHANNKEHRKLAQRHEFERFNLIGKTRSRIPLDLKLLKRMKEKKNITCGACGMKVSQNSLADHMKYLHNDDTHGKKLDENDKNNYKCGCGSVVKKSSLQAHYKTQNHKSYVLRYNQLQKELSIKKNIEKREKIRKENFFKSLDEEKKQN